MNKIVNTLLIVPLVAALSLAGCGGGSITVAEGGIGGTGISSGTVTDIGSIKVNGVLFETDSAAIYVEGIRVDDPDDPTDATGLFLSSQGFNVGQVVRVVGDFSADGKTGTADAVYYNDSLEGPVASASQIDATTQRLVVMGQLVIVDSQTKPDGVNLVTFDPNDIVEVSGLRDDQ